MQSVPSPQYDATAMVLLPPLKSPSSQTAFEEFPFEWLPMPQVLLHKDAVAANDTDRWASRHSQWTRIADARCGYSYVLE